MATGLVIALILGGVALVAVVGILLVVVLVVGRTGDTPSASSTPTSQSTRAHSPATSQPGQSAPQGTPAQAVALAKDAFRRCLTDAAPGAGINMDSIIDGAPWIAQPVSGSPGVYQVSITSSPGYEFQVEVTTGTVKAVGPVVSSLATAQKTIGRCQSIR